MRIFNLICFLLITQFSIGQAILDYATIDMKVAEIPPNQAKTTSGIAKFITSNFKTDNEKIRAIFYWTASNISYDVPNMNQPNNLDSAKEKIASALKTQKGVCIHYAEIFNEIANKVGIKSFIIFGYTKQFEVIAPISHAWNAAKIDGKWFLFDATWGAGFVEGKKFTKKLNNSFFMPEPSKMILSHMPFDYLWQFLNLPITNEEFINGKGDTTKPQEKFDFVIAIDKYEKLTDEAKAFEAAARIEKNGILNTLIQDSYNLKKREFTVVTQNKSIEKLIEITARFNVAISDLNDFILFRNKQFKPTQSDEIVKSMLQNVTDKMIKCNNDVYNVGSVSPENTENLNSLKRSILQGIEKTKEQENFLNDYLKKDSLGRKMMFTISR